MGTALGIRTNEGIVLSSDTLETRDSRVISKERSKLSKISKHAGSAFAPRPRRTGEIRAQANLYRIERREPIPIRGLARKTLELAQDLEISGVIGGVASEPELYRVDPDGMTREKKFAAIGRGAQTALGVLEEGYDPEMSLDDAKKLAVRAIQASEKREATTGGVQVAVVDEEGFRKLSEKEIEKLKEEE